jgi:TRAP-type C4-dicarboxylate transport system permease small subunit
MRKFLDVVYNAAAYLAALFLVGTLTMILLGIFGRILNFQVRGSDAYAGYLMAGSGFLALAHTLKRSEHIRVTLILQHLKGGARRALQLVAVAIGAVLAVALAWYSVRLAWLSYAYHDVSSGNDVTPLWIPQIAMALGTFIFAIAVIDEFLLAWSGREIDDQPPAELAHTE